MKKLTLAFALLFISVAVFAAPKYVIFIIGDGMGLAQRQFAEYYKQEITGDKNARLLMNTFPVTGFITTHSADSFVTDSAAAGTALATGHKTNNGFLGIDTTGAQLKNMAEAAKERGWAVGVVSNTRITHATPAVFLAHNKDRDDELNIAIDTLSSKADFIAGGGYSYFAPKNNALRSKRTDDRDLFAEFKNANYTVFAGENESGNFLSHTPKKGEKVIALLTPSHLPYEIDRRTDTKTPKLSDIAGKALEFLEKQKKPFFIMIEHGKIDHACHAGDLGALAGEMMDADALVEKAYNFYRKHPKNTLIIVTADHETGGLGLGGKTPYAISFKILPSIKSSIEEAFRIIPQDVKPVLSQTFGIAYLTDSETTELASALEKTKNGGKSYEGTPLASFVSQLISARTDINWTTSAHSAAPVPLTAVGKDAEKFGGYRDNTEIPKILAKLLGFNLP